MYAFSDNNMVDTVRDVSGLDCVCHETIVVSPATERWIDLIIEDLPVPLRLALAVGIEDN